MEERKEVIKIIIDNEELSSDQKATIIAELTNGHICQFQNIPLIPNVNPNPFFAPNGPTCGNGI